MSVDYDQTIKYYNLNKDKPWSEWLVFDTLFNKPGKQGFVGLFRLKDDPRIKIVFKISQYINHLSIHEHTVMNGLNDLHEFCPHFCKSIGLINCKVDPKIKKEGNPFDLDTQYPIVKETLLCEYITDSYKFYNYIRTEEDRIPEKVLYNAIKQVLLAVSIAQRCKRFSHYDLHSNNIMMKRCNPDTVFLYALDDDNQFCVPTFGHYPVIIDFGFSYINDMEDAPLWASMGHTDVGFMTDRFDWVADPKLLLVTVADEIHHKRDTKNSKKLTNIVKNIFCPLSIEWDSGWDKVEKMAAADYVTRMLSGYNSDSELFQEYDCFCIDIIQTLIILPLQEQSYSEIHKPYKAFLQEWVKIEAESTSMFYNLYVLKGVVDSARLVRAMYMRTATRGAAIRSFTEKVYECISSVAKFCNPRKVNFERLLCSLLVLSRCIEGVLYDVMITRMKDKQEEYDKMLLQSTEQIFAAIDANLPDDYVYTPNTKLVILDVLGKQTDHMELTQEECDDINDLHHICRGATLYDLYKQKKE